MRIFEGKKVVHPLVTSDVPTTLWTGKKSSNQRYSTKSNQSGFSK
jgi:hypothetical protein